MIPATFSRLAIFLGLCSCVIAAPLNNLEARANCADGKEAPCICGNALGLRQSSSTLRNNCGNQSFKFTNAASGTVGTVSLVSGNTGAVQCGIIVELQFIADEISKVPAICTHFQSTAGAADFQAFFNTINSPPNTVFVEGTVNNAKGVVFGKKSFSKTTQKAANGVISYLNLLKTNGANNVNPGTHAATTVDAAMTTAVGAGNGFPTGFQSRFDAAVNAAIKTFSKIANPLHVCSTTTQAPKLAPAPAAGDPFVDETASTIAKCTRGLLDRVQDFVVRAVTGKPATTASQCALPAKPAASAKPAAKPAVTPAAKPVAKPAAKPAAKPVAKPAAKPVAKPAVRLFLSNPMFLRIY
ncbi:hypothetical protein GGX14DRAFT_536554 [Mycena pura]|uniref:Uncharacterized protein n=1 Tax=Mycena pura TaxID=153505 RepID=A0AAD6V4G1_9AGAR|nr:hypothetical protein GGX14DRAFT_536554 [Mycena pura]